MSPSEEPAPSPRMRSVDPPNAGPIGKERENVRRTGRRIATARRSSPSKAAPAEAFKSESRRDFRDSVLAPLERDSAAGTAADASTDKPASARSRHPASKPGPAPASIRPLP